MNWYSTSGVHLHFCSMEVNMGKIKMSVTSAYIECATGKWYHLIELANNSLVTLFEMVYVILLSLQRQICLPHFV